METTSNLYVTKPNSEYCETTRINEFPNSFHTQVHAILVYSSPAYSLICWKANCASNWGLNPKKKAIPTIHEPGEVGVMRGPYLQISHIFENFPCQVEGDKLMEHSVSAIFLSNTNPLWRVHHSYQPFAYCIRSCKTFLVL